MTYCERRCGRAGFGEDEGTGMWVCAACGNPTRVYFENGVQSGSIRLLLVTPEQYAHGYHIFEADRAHRKVTTTHHKFRKVRDDEHGNVVVVKPREDIRHP